MPGIATTTHTWVDDVLLAGDGAGCCLSLGTPISRDGLRDLVARRQTALTAGGLRAGGPRALTRPPSTAYVAELLAAWRIGAQVTLLDHRLTPYEVDAITDR